LEKKLFEQKEDINNVNLDLLEELNQELKVKFKQDVKMIWLERQHVMREL